MGHGGKRPGAGRKPGTSIKHKMAQEAEKIVGETRAKGGMLPLDVMLEAMKLAYQDGGAMAAMPFAVQAAPYVHPKLAAVEQTIEQEVTYAISGEPLSEDQWQRTYGNLGAATGAAEIAH